MWRIDRSALARRAGTIGDAIAVFVVLLAYAFFGSLGDFEFRRVTWADSYYASLAEGFLSGSLTMAHVPDPALAQLPNPYAMEAREGIAYLWDASYYERKYYLYFSPLPALLFTIPFRLVGGGYPSDALTLTFFLACAFLAGVAFVRRALRHARPAVIPRAAWILFIGLGNLVPFTLIAPRVYEIAIGCGMTMAALWAYALLRFIEAPSWRRAALVGLFLALAIACRPHLLLLGIVTLFMLVRGTPRTIVLPSLAAIAVPLVIVGSAYAAYNHGRFGSPLETGMSYQLTTVPMQDEPRCGIRGLGDVTRFFDFLMHYLFHPPKFFSTFPFVDLRWNDVDRLVSFRAKSEQVGGLAPIAPLAIVGLLAAAILALAGKSAQPEVRAAVLVVAGASLILIVLSLCRWITSRYALDFFHLFVIGGIVAIEYALRFLQSVGVRIAPLRAACAILLLFSIVSGTLLGFSRNNTFRDANPELHERLAKPFR